MTALAISPDLNVDAPMAALRRSGRAQIADFLTAPSAALLLAELEASKAWRLTANRGEQIMDFPPEVLARFGDSEWAKLDRAVTMGGRFGFQFRYETIRLKEEGSAETPSLVAFEELMSSPGVTEQMRKMTGITDIDFADAHASRYSSGHFLTAHDDQSAGMGRRAAYVLNLTPAWRPDWGGLLLFHDADGNISGGFTPAYNVLNVFSVPQPHSVSWVTPLAAAPRYAVTGWLRARTPASP